MLKGTLGRAALSLAAIALATVAQAGTNPQDFSMIQRGRYLATAGDCAGCHSGRAGAYAGGDKIATPFGTVAASNITPDEATGIGSWTDDQFARALTRGIRNDGAHLYPAMPYPYFTKLSRSDVLAIRAYLATVAPVHNIVHADQLPFPFNVRAGMAAWDWLYFTPGPFYPVAGKSPDWNRGAYLVEGAMHCGACHTPKNFAGADENNARLQGNALEGWFAPDITNDSRRGLGGWSIEDVVAYLKTGHNRIAAAAGPMADEVGKSSSHLSDADLRAVTIYLKDQSGAHAPTPEPVAASDPAMKAGTAIYADECAACHRPHGTGVAGLLPALAGSPAVQSVNPASLIHVVLAGTPTVATAGAPTAPAMPAFAWVLDDRETAAVLTYIRNSWGNAAAAVTPGDVQARRKKLGSN